MWNSFIWPIDKNLSGATSPGQSDSESNDNEGVLHILQSSSTTGTSPSDCLISYQDTLWGGGSYLTVEMQSVYSTALETTWLFL